MHSFACVIRWMTCLGVSSTRTLRLLTYPTPSLWPIR
nr:MAG TPA: hypothetical protein [Caudoviricetes sp.]